MNNDDFPSLCKDCKSELRPGARKCAECGSHQGIFSRWVSPFGITAVTIFTLLNFPQIKDATESKRAVIDVSIVRGDFRQISFMVANTGNRPAAIESAEIRSTTEAGKSVWFYLQNPLKDSVLKPGEAVLAKAANDRAIPADSNHGIQLAHMDGRLPPNCLLQVGIVQMDGRHEQVDLPFYCIPVDPQNHGPLQNAKPSNQGPSQ